jgi:hypothetical protein
MSFVRAGREIENVDAFPRSAKDISSGLGEWPHLQSYAYHWGVEVKFGPELDDVFGITNDKQRVRPIEDFWKLLADDGVDLLLNRVNTKQRTWRSEAKKAAQTPQTSLDPTPAEMAAQVVDTVFGQPTPIPDHERENATESFTKATHERSEESGKPMEEVAKAVEAEANRRPFRIDYFDMENGPFFKPYWELGTRIVIWINRKHAFYETLYLASKSKLAKEGLDLFLIALGKAELTVKDHTAKLWYQVQREKYWSEFLAVSMKALLNDFQDAEEEDEDME